MPENKTLFTPVVTRIIFVQLGWVIVATLLLVICVTAGLNFAVPFVLLISAWLFKVGWQYKKDAEVLDREMESDFDQAAYKNGQWVAVQGKLTMLIPGSDREFPDLLAYYFRVFDIERSAGIKRIGSGNSASSASNRMATRRYDGFYLIPTGIATNNGIVKLSAFPDLTALEKSPIPSEIYTRGESQAKIGTRWLPTYLQRARLTGGVSNQVDRVTKYGDRDREGRGSSEYMSLENGDDICLFGCWQDGALVASKSRPRGLPVYKLKAADLLLELQKDGRAFTVAALFFLAVAAALVGWSFWSS